MVRGEAREEVRSSSIERGTQRERWSERARERERERKLYQGMTVAVVGWEAVWCEEKLAKRCAALQ